METLKEKVLAERYLQDGETEEDMYRRVASHLAGTDRKLFEEYFEIMKSGLFLPNTPTLVNAGAAHSGCLSACFVVPLGDSLKDIYAALTQQGEIHKAFGGTGFDFSVIRPKGDLINTTRGEASGPVKFMKLFNQNADAVRQGGKREGGNMGVLRIDHPDIRDWISCKDVEGVLTHFNLSVSISDEFLKAYHSDKLVPLLFKNYSYAVGGIKSKELLHEIAEHIWKTGEPGVLFSDNANKDNLVPQLGKMTCTNPCGEQWLLPHESCNLGSINLSKFVVYEDIDTPYVDYCELERVVEIAVRMLNAVIDCNTYPIPEVEQATNKTRKIGLGVTGWHDMLIKMDMSYGGPSSLNLASGIMKSISLYAEQESKAIASETSVFPAWAGSEWERKNIRVANASLTTIAPTGTLSILMECSSGIEPIPYWVYMRHGEVGEIRVVHPTYELAKARGRLDTAEDISWEYHLSMQSEFQKHVHSAISKTVILPNTATVEDIEYAIIQAATMGCKGVTFYRTGSREDVVYAVEDKQVTVVDDVECSERPSKLSGDTIKIKTGCGAMFVTLNSFKGKLYEVILPSATRGCQPNREAIGRLITKLVKAGVPLSEINGELQKCKCTTAISNPGSECKGCPPAIGNMIMELAGGGDDVEEEDVDPIVEIGTEHTKIVAQTSICPQCNAVLGFGEGCRNGKCKECGWSGCN